MKIAFTGGSGSVEVSEQNFAAAFNEPLVHQVITAHRAKKRSGSKAQKTRAGVRGGGAKPWRQKGTGRARAVTIRSPIWVGGGRTFAARPRDYSQKVNRKMYRAAMRSVLSELLRQERLVAIDSFEMDQPKTRNLAARLKEMGLDSVLILVDRYDDNLCLAARNLPDVDVLDIREVNPVSLVRFGKVLATAAAISELEKKLS